jgi:hypothetical protein
MAEETGPSSLDHTPKERRCCRSARHRRGRGQRCGGRRPAAFKVPVRVFPRGASSTTGSTNGLKFQKAKLRRMAADRL